MGQCLRNLLGLLTILGLEVGAWSVEPTSAVDPVRQVAFTFDDLPAVRPRGLENTQALTAALVGRIAAEGIPAVGFVNEGKLADLGLDAAAGAALLEPWLAAVLELGNHTRSLRWFRHPYLNTGPDSAGKAAFEGFLERVVVHHEDQARRTLGREPAQVLLLHANWLNAERLGPLVRMFRQRGYEIVTLDEALEDPAYALPDTYIGKRGMSWLERWALSRGQEPGEMPEAPDWVRAAACL